MLRPIRLSMLESEIRTKTESIYQHTPILMSWLIRQRDNSHLLSLSPLTMIDFRIIDTLQTGVVRKPHLPNMGSESVYLFSEFTINKIDALDAF